MEMRSEDSFLAQNLSQIDSLFGLNFNQRTGLQLGLVFEVRNQKVPPLAAVQGTRSRLTVRQAPNCNLFSEFGHPSNYNRVRRSCLMVAMQNLHIAEPTHQHKKIQQRR